MDISLVVCTYNRAEMLRPALESLTCQETDEKFSYEVLVIDDGSTDGTRDVVNDFIKKTPKVPIRYVHKEGGGIGAARNRGIKEVCSKWIAFFDDDQWAEPHWLLELYKVAVESEAHCVGGTVLLDFPDSANLKLGPFCRSLLMENIPGPAPGRWPIRRLPSTCNVIVRRQLFERIGTFDASLLTGGDDVDFFWRADVEGAVMRYAPKATIHHIIPESRLRSEYVKHRSLRVGLDDCQLRYKYRGRLGWFLGLGRRIIRSFARDVWLLLIALLLGDKSQELDRKSGLWCTLGYGRGSLSLLAPRVFTQKTFFESLNFRSRGAERPRENGHRGDKI